jgi:hypothetical protein
MSFPVAAAALDDFAGAMEVRCTRILTSEGGIGVTYLFDDRVNRESQHRYSYSIWPKFKGPAILLVAFNSEH